jgi:hypothetical protein
MTKKGQPAIRFLFSVAVLSGLFPLEAAAAEPAPTITSIERAVTKSLALLERGARVSMKERARCFTCHNQGMPIMAMVTARARGLKINDEELQRQVQFTAEFLAKNQTNYLAGKGQGGEVDTAGYALWALANGGWKAGELTAAVTEYLLLWQKDQPHWQAQSRRPPTEQSPFTSTHVALRGLKAFGTPGQRERIERRVAEARRWLLDTPARDTEDRVFRLRALAVAGETGAEVQKAVETLKQTQRPDGGWAQLDDMESDPYATGTALAALHQAGGLATTDPAYQKGLRYLLDTQLEDGSWHVATRSHPIQTYYESGYPHGEDQFISISAAGWATTALALALPSQEPRQ